MKFSEIATFLLDRDLQIKSYTPKDTGFLKIHGADVGRPFSCLTGRFNYQNFEEDALCVLSDLAVIDRELRDDENRLLQLRLSPWLGANDKIDGIAVTFINITGWKNSEKLLQEEKEYAELLLDTVREGLLVLDDKLQVQSGNESFYHFFQTDKDETVGNYLYELGDNQWDIPELRKLLEEILPESKVVNDYEIEHEFERIGQRIMLLNARQIDHLQLILLAIEDVTERKQAARKLRRANETLEQRVEERTRQVRKLVSRLIESEQKERRRISYILHDELQQILFAIQMSLNFMNREIDTKDEKHLSEQMAEALQMTEKAIEKTRELSGDLNPFVLKSPQLTDMLEWIADRFEKMYELKTELKIDGDILIPDEETRVMLLQIVRELLFNVVKHAGTDHAVIQVNDMSENGLVIEVVDEGCGFPVNNPGFKIENKKGFGLFNIQERLNLFGGSLKIDSDLGKGTCMTIHIPK